MKDDLLIKELKCLRMQNSKIEYLKAIQILKNKRDTLSQAKEIELDSDVIKKYNKHLEDIEIADQYLKENKNKYFTENQITENEMEDYILNIDKIWENLYAEKVRYEAYFPLNDFSYLNLSESMAVIRAKNYSSIFKAHEIVAIETLRSKYQSLWVNRSFLSGELLIQGKNEYQNLERYVATELGYSNRDEIPFGSSEEEYFRAKKSGTPVIFNLKKHNIHFRHLNCFQ